ncbi:superoxide dismutase family protein [Chromohalobacter canadensis]|uniref:superoxide dismutase [Cu-Zn] SodC n=1 Tax=Chromohalobacter canadensis TaxID=141389 RepID=UPI0021BFD7B7|nr:superoxide dismutase [Cu-Zn] SodC [Chromohalobacter canadensis]MCT8468763.1 superoxide dismutase family protein [Chromohalobacter canadensis]MCT8473047.1 superoxide dismutase family protein [Chromohalobacter canadensis]MCT8500499.1 superoxide dismutase family protein [Chromohalobacter canadensis]
MLRTPRIALGIGSALLMLGSAQAAEHDIEMHQVDAQGTSDSVGSVTLQDTDHGLLLTPDLSDLDPGMHGFHVHMNPSCQPSEQDGETVPGGAAGGHYDPEDTGTHQGPYAEGHLGDLPVLMVDEDGNATTPVLAPRLEASDLEGRALMIHAGGDNYSDEPKLGGGGKRVACGTLSE